MKKLRPLFAFMVLLLAACSKEEETVTPVITSYEKSVIAYFKQIALGFEFGGASHITRKWPAQMKIFVGGQPSPELEQELERIKSELNALATDNFSMEVVTDSLQANYYIFFGSGQAFADRFPALRNAVNTNWGLFTIFWNSTNQLTSGYMYVDIYRANLQEQKHLLREELTQSLGLGQDSPIYLESIFQANWTRTTEYAPIDRDVIRLLYHPQMSVGLNESQVDQVLQAILLKE